jgi:surface antigen
MTLTSRVGAPGAILVAAIVLHGCAGNSGTSEDIGRVSEALDICSETVPANRNVDGIPAYSQCAAAQNSPIYSDNGVNTSTSSMGANWVLTQYNSGYQCTEFAHRYLHFRWQITWEPNGDAGTWCDSTPPSNSGVVQTSTPVHGDLIVFAPGTCGSDPVAGHVAVVDTVSGTNSVTAVEQNSAGRSPYKQSCAKCYLHVVANNASDASSPIGGGDAAASAGGTDAMTSGTSVADSMAPFDAVAAQPPSNPTADDAGGSFMSSSDDAAPPDAAESVDDAGANNMDTPAAWGSGTAASKGCSASGRGIPGGDRRGLVVLVGLALVGLGMRSRRERTRGRAE